jgi:hypothetical protein
MKFTYSSGQRPLDGYTLKRGVGRGGFGEVYYGLSDGGKEVALKLVRGNLEVELRGMGQCLNFKHPNLINLFDLRTDAQGDHWVVMEYVAGEPLNAVLNRHPQGLPLELAKQWFVALAAAVGYLHDHGIVHRDLKPANIFLENGTVKVGDYGLSKFISTSRGSAQTQSVGTVHYMAPEISTGNYNKQIDVYAAGIIFYEMLTGHVPFEGESAGEILMKHLTSPPDLSKVPDEFRPIVDRALRKNPVHRFQTMAEMSRAVEAVGAAPEEVAEALPGRVSAQPVPPAASPVPVEVVPVADAVATPRQRVAELCGSMIMAAVLAGLFSILLTAVVLRNNLTEIGVCFFLTVACSWAVLVPSKLWPWRDSDSWSRRGAMLVVGLGVGLLALWLDGRPGPLLTMEPPGADSASVERAAVGSGQSGGPRKGAAIFDVMPYNHDLPVAACYLSYFGLAFFILRWWRMADPRRSQRFSLFPVLAAGFWAYVLLMFWPWVMHRGVVALVMTSAIVQLVSPWVQPPPARAKRLRLRYA